MSRPRKSIDQIELDGNSGNLTPLQIANRRAEKDAPLTLEKRTEIQRLDDLISKAMHACSRGQTVRGKKNPSFANLSVLVKLRSHMLTQKREPADAEEVLAEFESLMSTKVPGEELN
jgi:hypothetical protein